MPLENTHGLEPFTHEQYAVILVSGASTNFQLWTAPYASPALETGYIKQLAITNSTATVMEVRMWDQDLANSAVPARGSGSFNGCLMAFGVAASATSGVGLTTQFYNIPSDTFQGGIAVQCSQANAKIMATIAVR